MAFAGLRFGEVAGLSVAAVDTTRGRILQPRLATYVAGRAANDALFTSMRGGPLRNSNFRHYIFDSARVVPASSR